MIDEKVSKILDLLIEGIQKGTDLAQVQLPQIAEELLKYEAWDCKLGMIYSSIVFAVIVFVMFRVYLNEGFDHPFNFLAGPIILIVSSVVFCCNFSNLHKIEVAPKVYLIEYLRCHNK